MSFEINVRANVEFYGEDGVDIENGVLVFNFEEWRGDEIDIMLHGEKGLFFKIKISLHTLQQISKIFDYRENKS